MHCITFLQILLFCQYSSFNFVQSQDVNYDGIEFDFDSVETDPDLDPGRVLALTPPETPTEYPSFITGPVKSLHAGLFNDTFNLILSKGLFFNSKNSKTNSTCFEYKSPSELKSIINMELGEVGVPHEELTGLLDKVIQYSPHVSHPFYLHRNGAGLDPYGIIGDMLASSLSSVLLTFYAAPVFTLMEWEITKKIRELVGYPNGVGDGITSPGPSFANIMALQVALTYKNSQIKNVGLVGVGSPKFVIFISEAGCSSFVKAAILEGFGQNSLTKIRTDSNGRMDVKHLKEEVEAVVKTNVSIPLMIVATAGTPILGAIDPINDIANIASENKIWLHIDGTMASPLLLSETYKDKLAGVNRSDSFTWSSSYMFGLPSTSSFIVTKYENILANTFGYNAQYVFAKSVLYNHSYDHGDSTIQTCRRPDVLKTWFLWKGKGFKGLQSHIDHVYKNTKEFIELLTSDDVGDRKSKFLLLANNTDTPTVSFNYIPKSLRGMDSKSEEFKEKISVATEKIKADLTKSSIMELSISTLPNDSTHKFFTISLTNSVLTKPDLAFILEQIESYGEGNTKKSDSAKDNNETPPNPQITFSKFVSSPIKTLHRTFFIYIFQHLIKTGIFYENKRKDPAKRFRTPEELEKIIDLNFGATPLTENNLLGEFDRIIQFSAHQAHPFWVYQLFTGLNPYTLIGDFIVSIMNTGMESYDNSPVFSLAEAEVLQNVRKLVGYPNGEGDGVINPGGTMSNIMSMTLARYKASPDLKENGLANCSATANGKKLVLYMNIGGHYSFNKGSFLLGIGLENCVLVGADEFGRMSIPELRKEISKTLAEGNVPFMVAATGGTTVLGSVDPIKEIGEICKEHGMWFHVDGVFGGAMLFSETHKKKLEGIEMSDSLTFNPHKMFGATMTCSIFVTRHTGIIEKAVGIRSDLIKEPNPVERGDNHILGARRANGFKFWLLWKAQGTSGLGKHIDYVFENTKYAMDYMREHNDSFHMIIPDNDLTNVCFIYIPIQYRLLDRTTAVFRKELDSIADQIQFKLVKNGIMDIVVQRTAGMDTPRFMKLVLMSSTTNKADIKYLLEQIDYYGKDL